MVILAILCDKDAYGYELVCEIERRSGGKFASKEGSIYPTLYRLEDNKYISSKKVESGKRRIRTYYHIEDSGREYYKLLRKSYCEINEAVMRIIKYNIYKWTI